MNKIEVSYVIPCLNEEATIGLCVKESIDTLLQHQIAGEVVVVDNGSTDNSVIKAKEAGARIVYATTKGYGAALQKGFEEAKGEYICMGDADMSYDFSTMPIFLNKLTTENLDMVVGCRFSRGGGEIQQGAMPWMNKYIGNPILSFVGQKLFAIPVKDFHCGLRLFRKSMLLKVKYTSPGMEFASEMIVKAHLAKCKMGEVPITLRKDMRQGTTSHLSPFRDGVRHLYILGLCWLQHKK